MLFFFKLFFLLFAQLFVDINSKFPQRGMNKILYFILFLTFKKTIPVVFVFHLLENFPVVWIQIQQVWATEGYAGGQRHPRQWEELSCQTGGCRRGRRNSWTDRGESEVTCSQKIAEWGFSHFHNTSDAELVTRDEVWWMNYNKIE